MDKTMDKTIVVLKLYSGDYIIGESRSSNGINGIIDLDNPRLLLMMPTMSGAMSVSLKPLCYPFTSARVKEHASIPEAQVMCILDDSLGEIEKEIVNGYKSDISGIKLATSAEAAAIENGNNGFVL